MSLLDKAAGQGAGGDLAPRRNAPVTAPRRLVEQASDAAPSPVAALPLSPACSPPCAAEVYERIEAACCPEHGLGSPEALQGHIRAVVLSLIALRNAPPRMARSA